MFSKKVLIGLFNQVKSMNNPDKTDRSFERITTKILLEEKDTDFPSILEERNETSRGIWYETVNRLLTTTSWDIDGIFILDVHIPPILREASEVYHLWSMKLYMIMAKLL